MVAELRPPPQETADVMSILGNRNGGRRTCAHTCLLCRRRDALGYRQLQDRYPLSFAELRHQHSVSVWKFDRVMMTMRNGRINDTELSHPKFD